MRPTRDASALALLGLKPPPGPLFGPGLRRTPARPRRRGVQACPPRHATRCAHGRTLSNSPRGETPPSRVYRRHPAPGRSLLVVGPRPGWPWGFLVPWAERPPRQVAERWVVAAASLGLPAPPPPRSGFAPAPQFTMARWAIAAAPLRFPPGAGRPSSPGERRWRFRGPVSPMNRTG